MDDPREVRACRMTSVRACRMTSVRACRMTPVRAMLLVLLCLQRIPLACNAPLDEPEAEHPETSPRRNETPNDAADDDAGRLRDSADDVTAFEPLEAGAVQEVDRREDAKQLSTCRVGETRPVYGRPSQYEICYSGQWWPLRCPGNGYFDAQMNVCVTVSAVHQTATPAPSAPALPEPPVPAPVGKALPGPPVQAPAAPTLPGPPSPALPALSVPTPAVPPVHARPGSRSLVLIPLSTDPVYLSGYGRWPPIPAAWFPAHGDAQASGLPPIFIPLPPSWPIPDQTTSSGHAASDARPAPILIPIPWPAPRLPAPTSAPGSGSHPRIPPLPSPTPPPASYPVSSGSGGANSFERMQTALLQYETSQLQQPITDTLPITRKTRNRVASSANNVFRNRVQTTYGSGSGHGGLDRKTKPKLELRIEVL